MIVDDRFKKKKKQAFYAYPYKNFLDIPQLSLQNQKIVVRLAFSIIFCKKYSIKKKISFYLNAKNNLVN